MSDSGTRPRHGWEPRGHCTIFACDIASFGARPDPVQAKLREVLYAALESSFEASGLPYNGCYREDRGDGAIVVLPPSHDPALLVHPLPDHIRGALRTHNRLSVPQGQMRLRVALHAGTLASDQEGMVGTTVNHAARLLDAPAFKQAMQSTTAPLGVLASEEFYRAVIQPGPGPIDPEEFRPIQVLLKETDTTGWLNIREPGQRHVSTPEPKPDPASHPTQQVEALPSPDTPPGTVPPAGNLTWPSRTRQSTGSTTEASRSDARTDEARTDEVSAAPLALPPLFEVVRRLMDIPLLTSVDGREDIVASLRPDIATRVPRRSRGQQDILAIVRTCAEFPDGLQEFLAVLQELVGETMQMADLEEAIVTLIRRQSL